MNIWMITGKLLIPWGFWMFLKSWSPNNHQATMAPWWLSKPQVRSWLGCGYRDWTPPDKPLQNGEEHWESWSSAICQPIQWNKRSRDVRINQMFNEYWNVNGLGFVEIYRNMGFGLERLANISFECKSTSQEYQEWGFRMIKKSKGNTSGNLDQKELNVHQPQLDENQLACDILHRIATVQQIVPTYSPINTANNAFYLYNYQPVFEHDQKWSDFWKNIYRNQTGFSLPMPQACESQIGDHHPRYAGTLNCNYNDHLIQSQPSNELSRVVASFNQLESG